jgi:HAD domain in Swiss Army Knife RNA repair proteins
MILFLDFDGVLHPDAVYRVPGRGIVLETALLPEEYANTFLFCYRPFLESVLADFPKVSIVLSTSWVATLGFDRSREQLSQALRARVLGATYHRVYTPKWHDQTRFEQILEYVARHRLGSRWLAIDNDHEGWPDSQYDHLVLTDDHAGLGGCSNVGSFAGAADGFGGAVMAKRSLMDRS